MAKKTLVVVVGPTAIGKTQWAIQLAREFDSVVLSSDSRQFYKEMSIGTAVPTTEELSSVPHYFIQHRSIHEPYTVGDFEKDATKLLTRLFKKHQVVLMTGGSGLYIDAVTEGLDHFPAIDPSVRTALNTEFKANGIKGLQDELALSDPEYFSKVDLQNPHRLIRALEVCRATGKPYSSFLGKEKDNREFACIYVGITAEREDIYQRINTRVDKMLKQGLVAEARELYPYRQLPALQTVGYKELFNYFDGSIDLNQAREEIAKNTRRYAKRQLTWFNQRPEIKWFQREVPLKKVKDYILAAIEKNNL